MAIQWPLLAFSVLLGISSGCFVFLAIGEITGRFKNVRFLGVLIAFICLALGGIASVFHLGHPERATHLLGNMASGLTKEIVVVAIMGILSIIYLVLSRKNYPVATKIVGVLAGLAGLALPFIAGASYLMAARPAWNSLALPFMYLGGGLGMGTLLMAALVYLKGDAKADGAFGLKIALAGVAVLVVTSVIYIAWIAMAPYQDPSRSLDRLISGDLAIAFWAGIVIVGLVLTVVLSVLAQTKGAKAIVSGTGDEAAQAKRTATLLFAAFVCALVGAVVIRAVMFLVGSSVESFIY